MSDWKKWQHKATVPQGTQPPIRVGHIVTYDGDEHIELEQEATLGPETVAISLDGLAELISVLEGLRDYFRPEAVPGPGQMQFDLNA